jgi:uncharacterized membrane protein
METTQIIWVAACVIAALIMFFRLGKSNKIFIAVGFLCLLFGAYLVADATIQNEMFRSAAEWSMRGVALMAAVLIYLVMRNEREESKLASSEGDTASDTADGEQVEVGEGLSSSASDDDSSFGNRGEEE